MNTTADIDPQDAWQALEAEVKPKIENLDSSYSHFFDENNLKAKFLTSTDDEALKNFKDLVGNMKGVLVEIDPTVFPQANRAAISSKVKAIQDNLTTEKAKTFFSTQTATDAINALRGGNYDPVSIHCYVAVKHYLANLYKDLPMVALAAQYRRQGDLWRQNNLPGVISNIQKVVPYTELKAKVEATKIWVSALPSTHPQKQELESALQTANGELNLNERFKSFTLAGGVKYKKEHTDKINHHATLLLEEASKKLGSTITPIKQKIEQEYVERVVAGKIAQLNNPAQKESPRLKALWGYVLPIPPPYSQEQVYFFSKRLTNTPNINILKMAEWAIFSVFGKDLLQYVNKTPYAGIAERILAKLDADKPFFVTPKKINKKDNPDYTTILDAKKEYQKLDANGEDVLRSEIKQDQALQAIFKNDGIANLEAAVAKKILALVKTPEQKTSPEKTVANAVAAPQKENITRGMIAPLEQPDLNTPAPTVSPTEELTTDSLKQYLQSPTTTAKYASLLFKDTTTALQKIIKGNSDQESAILGAVLELLKASNATQMSIAKDIEATLEKIGIPKESLEAAFTPETPRTSAPRTKKQKRAK